MDEKTDQETIQPIPLVLFQVSGRVDFGVLLVLASKVIRLYNSYSKLTVNNKTNNNKNDHNKNTTNSNCAIHSSIHPSFQ